MSVVTYQYKRWKNLRAPIIILAIHHRKRWYPVEAYVDSGATYSVFTAQVAELIGINYFKGKKLYIQVGDGGFIPIYLHNLKIQIGKYPLTIPLGFSEKLGVRFNLLGRTGIFDHFKVCFNEQKFVLTFTPYKKLYK